MALVLSNYEQVRRLQDSPPVEALGYTAMGDLPRANALHRIVPSPPRPQPTIAAADSESIICGMTRDGETLFATTVAGQLRKSTNENVSWSNVGSAFPAQIQWVTELDDGELFVTVTATGGAGGGAWKSSGWPDGTPTFTLVHSATANCYFTGDWGNDHPWESGVVTLTEYGSQGVARFAWRSLENGDAGTWDLIFTHPDNVGGADGSHPHGGCYDPHFQRYVFTGGDDTHRGVWYTDDGGATLNEMQYGRTPWARGVNAGAVQFVGCRATRAGIVFTTDSAPNGVFIAPRHRKEDVPYIIPLKLLSDSGDLVHIGRRMFMNGPDAPLLIVMSQQTGSGASYLLALHPESNEAHVLWKSDVDYPATQGLRAVVGPTAGGYYFGSIQNTTWFTARWKAPEWRVRSAKSPSRTVTPYVRHAGNSAIVAPYLSSFNFTGNELRIRYRGRLDSWAPVNLVFGAQYQGGAAGKSAWKFQGHSDGRPAFFWYTAAGAFANGLIASVALSTVLTAGDWATVEITVRKNNGGGLSDMVTRYTTSAANYDPAVTRGYSKGTWSTLGTTATAPVISTMDTAATSGLSFNADANGTGSPLAGDFEWAEIWHDGVLVAAPDVRDGQLTPGDKPVQSAVVKPDFYGGAGEAWELVGAATCRAREDIEEAAYYDRYIKLADVTAMPPVPASGGALYVVAGQLRYRGSGGTISNLANA